MNMNSVVMVVDGERLGLQCVLSMIIAKRTTPDINVCVGIPKDAPQISLSTRELLERFAGAIFTIPPPSIRLENRTYRIINKVNALRYAPCGSKVILADSDLIFARELPFDFLTRPEACAVPEHGFQELPWSDIYEHFSLKLPQTLVLLGSGRTSLPWLNAGFVSSSEAEKFGDIWYDLAERVAVLDWVPKRWPYLDQIALPIAMAVSSASKTVKHDHILPSSFNTNLFYWAGDQTYSKGSFVIHHHGRIQLLRRYLRDLITWVGQLYPDLFDVMQALEKYDKGGTVP